MMKYKIIICISLLLVTILTFCFIYINRKEDHKQIVNIWTVDIGSRFNKYMEYLIDKFQNKNSDLKIVWKDFDEKDIISEIYESWHKNSLPDIISLSTNTLVNKLNKDLLYDLNELNVNFYDTFFEGILDSNKKDNKLLGIPWYTNIDVLYVNKSILDMCNIDKSHYPLTEKDFFNLLRNIKERSKKYGSVFNPENIKHLIYNGLKVIDSSDNVLINTPEIVEYFKKYQILFNNLIVPKKFLNFDDKLYLYSKGEVAMIKANVKFIDNMEKISKDIYNNTVVLPIPLGENNIRYADTVSLAIMKKSNKYKEAMKFMNFLVDKTNQIELINNFNILPVNKNINIDADISNKNSKKIQAKIIAFKSLEKSKDFTVNVNKFNEINNVIEKYSRNIYLEGLDVQNMIKEAQHTIDSLIK